MQEGTSNNSTGDHASRVATAMATSRKRPQLNGGAHALHGTKFPRRNITPSGTTMSSTGGILVPPQIRGRSVSLHPQKQFLTDQYPEQNLMHWGIKFSVLFQTIKLEEGFLLGRILLKVSYSPPYPGGSQFSSLSSLQGLSIQSFMDYSLVGRMYPAEVVFSHIVISASVLMCTAVVFG